MIERFVTEANTTQFSLDLANVTFPNSDPAITLAIVEGGLMDYVPKQACLKYVHLNCTFWGTTYQIALAFMVLLFAWGIFYMLGYLKHQGKI